MRFLLTNKQTANIFCILQYLQNFIIAVCNATSLIMFCSWQWWRWHNVSVFLCLKMQTVSAAGFALNGCIGKILIASRYWRAAVPVNCHEILHIIITSTIRLFFLLFGSVNPITFLNWKFYPEWIRESDGNATIRLHARIQTNIMEWK